MKYDVQLTHKIDLTDAQIRSVLEKTSLLFLLIGGGIMVYLSVSKPTLSKSLGIPLKIGK